jgi:hypothetical protein
LGLDAVAWAKAGLIDVLVPTPRWQTLEFDIPIQQWRKELGSAKTKLLGGVEERYQPCWRVEASHVTPELATGAATMVLAQGADAVYHYNYHWNGLYGNQPWPWAWGPAVFKKTLRAMGSLDSLLAMPRSVAVTFRDITAPGEQYRPPLPASGHEINCHFEIGPITEMSGACRLLVGFEIDTVRLFVVPAITVNGVPCRLLDDNAAEEGIRIVSFSVPKEALAKDAAQQIKVRGKGDDSVTILRLEMSLGVDGHGS